MVSLGCLGAARPFAAISMQLKRYHAYITGRRFHHGAFGIFLPSMVFATGTKAAVGVQDASSLCETIHLSHMQCSWVPKDLKNTNPA